ncbi:MAG: type II toxin-antitoxin system HicB family antitoxin [Niabella sp.]|nr:type II toxin-antitoxin system HicB family antitoxin [Niabella sp.]
MKKVDVLIEWSGDNFSAGTGEINGAVFATGKDLNEVKHQFESAFNFHIETAIQDRELLPAYILKGHFKLNYTLQASAMLHLADGLITRSALSRVTGINEKQLSHYLTGHRKPRREQNDKIAAGIITIGRQIRELEQFI